MNKTPRNWWRRGWQPWDALCAAADRGIGFALCWMGKTVRRPESLLRRWRILPAFEQLEMRYAPAAPTVTGVSPATGPTTGGTSVNITGTGFTSVQAVEFGSHAATFTVVSSTSITATAPANTTGPDDIIVMTTGGTSSAVPADKFTYTSAPLPSVTKRHAQFRLHGGRNQRVDKRQQYGQPDGGLLWGHAGNSIQLQ